MEVRDRILVFHRNQLFRDCLVRFLECDCDYEAIAMDHTKTDDADHWLSEGADLLLLDLGLPDRLAMEVATMVRDRGSATRVVLLVPEDGEDLVDGVAAGAQGCVHEGASVDELKQALLQVADGQTYCSGGLIAAMFRELSRPTRPSVASDSFSEADPRLTAREREVLKLVAEYKSNKEIAHELCVSLFTVKNHVHNILEKLHVENRMQAADFARRGVRLRY